MPHVNDVEMSLSSNIPASIPEFLIDTTITVLWRIGQDKEMAHDQLQICNL